MGSQTFQVKLNPMHQYPSWKRLSVPDTAPQLDISAIQPATDRHTHTYLCKPFFAHLSEKTRQRVPTIPVDTPVPQHVANKMA